MVQILRVPIKGRARFRVPQLYRSTGLQGYLERSLPGQSTIQSVTANPLTSNLLIVYSVEVDPAEIASLIAAALERYQQTSGGEAQPWDRGEQSGVGEVQGPSPPQPSEPWHLLSSEAVLNYFQSAKSGLERHIIASLLQKYGSNALAKAERRSELSILLGQFQSLPVALLGAAAAVSLYTGGVADALVILGVIGANGAIGYLTESQSEKIINSLTGSETQLALVLRQHEELEIPVAEIVPGDILSLKPGQMIAADARLLVADNLSVDESALTGESIPVAKTIAPLEGDEIPLGDRLNMVYRGTLVTGGQGLAVVVATGRTTEMGQIQTLVNQAKATETPLSRQLDQVGSQLVLLGTGVCGLVFGIGLLRGYGVLPMLKSAISLAVAAVPEGLPTIATSILALGIQNLRQHRVLVRKLGAVETLGSVQTICMDKTGTLTENKMAVAEVHTSLGCLQVKPGQMLSLADPHSPQYWQELRQLIQIVALCNETKAELQPDGSYQLIGSATEMSLIQLAIANRLDVLELRSQFPLLATNLRSENRNFMSTVHRTPTGKWLVAVKGSPTEVLERCNTRLGDGSELSLLSEAERLEIETDNDRMAGKALRVLGVAYAEIDPSAGTTDLEQELIWLGLVGMSDPVRSGVKQLIAQFHQAGIATVMITGDQSPTAYAIGKDLDLSQRQRLQILDSSDLSQLGPEALQALCEQVDVFARVSPANKLQIVQALQRRGRVVAMTGDGINDAPALKTADVGVAMGHSGTDTAREVADVILEDDRLETMIVAVKGGRTIYNNIRKAVHFLLATNLSEIGVMMIAIAAGLGEPLNPLQLLWLNLVSDVFPGLALAMEPPEPNILQQSPRNPDEPIIPPADVQRIGWEATTLTLGTLAAYGYGLARYGPGPRASTLAFLSLTTGQLVHTLSCRSPHQGLFSFSAKPLPTNPYLLAALAGSSSLLLVAAAVPWLRSLLQLTAIDALDVLVVGSSALMPFLLNEASKEISNQDMSHTETGDRDPRLATNDLSTDNLSTDDL